MEADDKIVKKSLSNLFGGAQGQNKNQRNRQNRESQMKVTYKAAIDTFRSVLDSSSNMNDSSSNIISKRGSVIGDEAFDIINNPLLSLQTIVKEHSIEEVSINDQIIRFFDRESRIYLMNLCGKIFDYDGEMLQFKDEQYKAPFRPSKQADKNLKKIYSIFTAVTEA